MSEQVKQVAEALKAAREAYITLFNLDLVKFGITPRSEACRAGEYDDDPQMQILAAAIQAAEVRGYERAIDDSIKAILSNANRRYGDDLPVEDAFKIYELGLDDAHESICALKKGGA